jgi:hypothetical protein
MSVEVAGVGANSDASIHGMTARYCRLHMEMTGTPAYSMFRSVHSRIDRRNGKKLTVNCFVTVPHTPPLGCSLRCDEYRQTHWRYLSGYRAATKKASERVKDGSNTNIVSRPC